MSPAPAAPIAASIAAVRARIARACERSGRPLESVTLIAVSKSQPVASIREAIAAGITDFGENYLQEARAKSEELARARAPASPAPRLHFIGHLQTNKAHSAVDVCAAVHSVDSARLALALDRAAQGRRLPVFLQLNLSGEPGKSGVAPVDLGGLLRTAQALPALMVLGLMTVPPAADDPERARPWFRALKALAHEHGLEGLSMGMTNDFEVAIEEGATHLRVGRSIFGERPL